MLVISNDHLRAIERMIDLSCVFVPVRAEVVAHIQRLQLRWEMTRINNVIMVVARHVTEHGGVLHREDIFIARLTV